MSEDAQSWPTTVGRHVAEVAEEFQLVGRSWMLSERDERVLAEIESHLAREDPHLDEVLRTGPGRSTPRVKLFGLLTVGLLMLIGSSIPGAAPLTFLVGVMLVLYVVVRLLLLNGEAAAAGHMRFPWQRPPY